MTNRLNQRFVDEAVMGAAFDMLRALQAQEAAEQTHLDCSECEGREIPELCSLCFPVYDDARIARRLAIAKATGTPVSPHPIRRLIS